jgi:cellulose 1,4-beta-cellobiosidase
MSMRRPLLSSGLWALALSAACAGTSSLQPKAITPPTAPPPPAVNPFAGARFYGDPEFVRTVARTQAPTPEDAARLKKLATFPTAVWLESVETAKLAATTLDDAHKLEAAGGGPVVPVFVIYDLPNRDCAAAGSRGELFVDKGGEARYQTEFIDVIAAAFAAHPTQKLAVILEPDSLPNLVTNLELPSCAAAADVYRRSVAYAVSRLSMPNVFIYLDAAHAGWLGWPKNLPRAVTLFKEVLQTAGGADRIRGFALNVSNYDPAVDPARTPRDRTSAASDETGYAADLTRALARVGVTGKGFVIDTGRDGRAYIRSIASSWCNVKGAGLGERPRAAPSSLIDAYLYVKVPGESDGTSDPNAPRFDPTCASDDAMPGAPQAGKMFDAYLIDLLKNANPPFDQ